MFGDWLAGTDTRFRTFVLICDREGFVRHYSLSQPSSIVRLGKNAQPEELKSLLAAMGPIDAKNFIGKPSVPLLFQAARFGLGVSEADTREYFPMAGEPREFKAVRFRPRFKRLRSLRRSPALAAQIYLDIR